MASGYDPARLPYDAHFVRYPQTLLSWYEDRANYAQLDLRGAEEREMVARVVACLRARRDEETEKREGGDGGGGEKLIALTPFSEEFAKFHFWDVDDREGAAGLLDIGRVGGVLSVTTQCTCMKTREEIGTFSAPTVRFMDSLIRKREGCFAEVAGGGWERGRVRSRLLQIEAEVRAAERDFLMAMDQGFGSGALGGKHLGERKIDRQGSELSWWE